MKRTASARKNSRSNGSSSKAVARRHAQARFAICVQNKDYEAPLQVRRIYRVIPDERAASHQYLRVMDESGEDYLYPESYFVAIDFPKAVRKALLLAS